MAEIVVRFDGPDLTVKDAVRLGAQLTAVRGLMRDEEWRTLPEIAEAIGGDSAGPMLTSISARLRDLRKSRFGGYLVDRRLRSTGLFEYRLSEAPPEEEEPEEEPELSTAQELGAGSYLAQGNNL